MVRAENVLDSWKQVRDDTIAAVEEFPPAELDFRLAPELMSFRELARHILDASHGLTAMLLAGETDFVAQFREKLLPHLPGTPDKPDSETLASGLRKSLDRLLPELAARTPEWFSEIITRFDGQQVTRLEMVQTLKEHELTHRSQMFVYLRLKGIVPVTTRRRLARQAAN